eukprot:COSAG01_NODE_11375_length_1949_cov_1.412973_2_plen_152_part_00
MQAGIWLGADGSLETAAAPSGDAEVSGAGADAGGGALRQPPCLLAAAAAAAACTVTQQRNGGAGGGQGPVARAERSAAQARLMEEQLELVWWFAVPGWVCLLGWVSAELLAAHSERWHEVRVMPHTAPHQQQRPRPTHARFFLLAAENVRW